MAVNIIILRFSGDSASSQSNFLFVQIDQSVNDMVMQYKQRRNLIVDGLNKLGLTCRLPAGAFYAFPSIRSTGLSSEDFARELLLREGVALVPGGVFGECGEGHVRCSYATSTRNIEEALLRIGKFLSSL